MSKRIHVIINPASGHPEPVLNTLNNVFYPAGVDWDVSITQRSGDAKQFAQRAVESGVDIVAAYGGDGTVMEVARGIRSSEIPLAILPGGTANLMTVELGIPRNLEAAAQTAVSETSVIRRIDMAKAGENYFLLRIGMGFPGKKVEVADRELKDRFGVLAYSIGAIKALKESDIVNFRIKVDGERHELEAYSLLIDNAGTFGVKGLSHSKQVRIDDGLLDVFVIRDLSLVSVFAMGASITDRQPDPNAFHHWQGRDIQIDAEPPVVINGDGELWGNTPISIRVIPACVKVITPPS